MNTQGNSLIDVEALMTEMGASTLTTAPRGRVLRTEASTQIHRRQLFGTLELITNNDTLQIDSTSTVVIVTFNIIMRNSLEASALMTALKEFAAQTTTSVDSRRALLYSADVLAGAIVSSSSNTTTLVTVDSSSVRSIILIFSKSYWGLFLDWLYRNVLNVLIGSGILFMLIFLIVMFRKYTGGSEERLRVKKGASAEKRLSELRKQVRQSSLKSKFRKVLRRVYPFFSSLVEIREEKLTKVEVGMEWKDVDHVTEFNDDVQIQEVRPLADPGDAFISIADIATNPLNTIRVNEKVVSIVGDVRIISPPATMIPDSLDTFQGAPIESQKRRFPTLLAGPAGLNAIHITPFRTPPALKARLAGLKDRIIALRLQQGGEGGVEDGERGESR